MNKMRWSLLVQLLPAFLCLVGCEKEVNIKLGSGAPKVVVEGFIENGQPPVVLLSRSLSFFKKIDLSSLENSFLHDADIRVSDGSREIKLREYSIDTGIFRNKFYFYTIDTAAPSSFDFRGETNRFYTLRITYENKVYTSTTKIPAVNGPDSIWAIPPAFIPEKVPTAMQLYIRYPDPDTLNNRIRYFTSRNNGLYLPGPNSVYEDAAINGTTFNLNLAAGINAYDEQSSDSLGYFFKGDTVNLRWCGIDKGVYDFYSTFEFAAGTIGNPFGTPIFVQTNISGGALGVWAGYGASYRTLIIPK